MSWLQPEPTGPQRVTVRTYKAGSLAEAARLFERDAALMAQYGWVPTSQSWAQGSWGCGAWLFALVLCLLLIGLLVFLYLLIVKPEGTLTVAYEFRPVARAETPIGYQDCIG